MLKDYIGVLLALSGWSFTIWHERRIQQRSGRLDRVNKQGEKENVQISSMIPNEHVIRCRLSYLQLGFYSGLSWHT